MERLLGVAAARGPLASASAPRGRPAAGPPAACAPAPSGPSAAPPAWGAAGPPSLVRAAALAAAAGGIALRRRAPPRRGRLPVGLAAAGTAEEPNAKRADAVDSSEAYREMLRRRAAAPPSPDEVKEDKGWFDFDDLEKREDFKTFLVSVSVALAFRFTIAEPRFIPSESMVPSFEIGDQLVVDKISKNWRDYQRRDVVVFEPPPLYWEVVQRTPNGDALIKRIVAIEGDYVEMKEGGVLVLNDEPQEETFTNERAEYTFSRRQVPPGNVLVLGDNRNRSLDGHVWGFLPVKNIIGRATFNWWPPWHVHTIAASPP
ncbi:unnamed protein product [Prorocentrum cordatum]|uniref:Mitochondrial inner membrane protease subunit n=1 Tax=Prorocentrum cordatum TaxID=2364126 RepID=A0ABN9PX65_9DINO|nr:unnamed protein product [Polarella glacialis]